VGLGAGCGCTVEEEVVGVEGFCGGLEGGASGGRAGEAPRGVEGFAVNILACGMAGAFPLDMGGEGR
jgi:hypothetical protein